MALGEYLAYSSLQADSKVQFAAWPTSWRPPGTDWLAQRNHSEFSHMAGAVDDGTINIVVVIIIIIIIPFITFELASVPASVHSMSAGITYDLS